MIARKNRYKLALAIIYSLSFLFISLKFIQTPFREEFKFLMNFDIKIVYVTWGLSIVLKVLDNDCLLIKSEDRSFGVVFDGLDLSEVSTRENLGLGHGHEGEQDGYSKHLGFSIHNNDEFM